MFSDGKPTPSRSEEVTNGLNTNDDLSINWNKISSRPIADSAGDIGLTGGLFLSGKIYKDTGLYPNVGGGTVWGAPNRSNPVLDLSSTTRLNIDIGNIGSIFQNSALLNEIISADITRENVMVHANLVSQGKLVGNTGTFNSVLSNLVTVSTLTTSDSFCGNMYVAGNLQTSGNVSMTRANVTSLVGQTATLTGNLVVPSADIASLQTGNVVFSNTSYHSNTTLIAPSVQTANLYVSNVSYLSNSALVAPSVKTANLYVSNLSYVSNSVLVIPSIQTANLYVSNVSYLSNAALVAPSIVSVV
eukprot:jgi/Botrbrau1/18070/Bobra.0062s0056.1